jgi:MoaA/NifB/PqqE/SkfB family radical SAM enzyme
MKKYCNEPFQLVNIEHNGDVSLCNCTSWHSLGIFGNLFDTSLEKIWTSSKAEMFRNSIFDQSFQYCNKVYCGKIWNLEEVDELPTTWPRLPTIVYFQSLDDTCNLQCRSCRNELRYSGKPDANADLILNKLIDEYQDFDEDVLIGGDGSGEFFASKSYMKFLYSPRLPKCFNFSINSNGTLLNKNIEIIKKYKDRFQNINVSFDAATAETYKDIRGHDFSQVTTGIQRVIDLGITVSAQYVIQAKNYHEIEDYKKLCDQLGVSFVGFQTINRWHHMSDEWWQANAIDDNPAVNHKDLAQSINRLRNLDSVGFDGRTLSIADQYS